MKKTRQDKKQMRHNESPVLANSFVKKTLTYKNKKSAAWRNKKLHVKNEWWHWNSVAYSYITWHWHVDDSSMYSIPGSIILTKDVKNEVLITSTISM